MPTDLPDDLPETTFEPTSAALKRLAERLRSARHAVALTGAGMSTESGLPDYRGPQGMWKDRRFEELANIEMFRSEPVEFWEFYRMRLATLHGAVPNSGHEALAAFERAGLLKGVVTQNVDGLHTAAGSTALEVHGTLAEGECLDCGVRLPIAEVEARAATTADQVPLCTCGATLKPAVVLFGEMLPPAVDEAAAMIEGCDLLLVCGSSLAVYPVNRFPQIVVDAGGELAIINRGPTEADHVAGIRIDAELGDTLVRLRALVGA